MNTESIHPAEKDDQELAGELEWRFGRRRGPGGQHRNKVETAVVVIHRPTGVQAEATRERSQAANRATALRRLKLELALAVRMPERAAQFPSARWKAHCRGRGWRVATTNPAFPAIVAELFDCLAACGGRLDQAARRLEVSTGQLLRFLRRHKRLWEYYRRHRASPEDDSEAAEPAS